MEGGLASFEVASVVLRTKEGEDDDISGNDTDKDTLDKSVVWYDLVTGLCLDSCLVLIATG